MYRLRHCSRPLRGTFHAAGDPRLMTVSSVPERSAGRCGSRAAPGRRCGRTVRQGRLRTAGVNLALVLTSVGFALAAGEVGLRIAEPENRRIPDARLGFRGNPAHPEHDSRGFRNPHALERADIVLLGDSHTYGTTVSPNDTWARVLAAETGATVYNMAIPAWGPGQAAAFLPDALALKPKTILYGLFFGNDFIDALQVDGRSEQLSPTLLPCREDRVPTGVRTFFRRSRIYGRARRLYRTVVPIPEAGDPEAGGASALVIAAPFYLCHLDDSDPRLRAGIEITKSTLLTMARDARAADATFAVVLLPTKESVFAPRVADLEAHDGLAELVAAESRLRDELTAVLRADDVPVLDVLPALRNAPRQPYPVIRDQHPNAAGLRVIGLETARFVHGMRAAPRSPGKSHRARSTSGC